MPLTELYREVKAAVQSVDFSRAKVLFDKSDLQKIAHSEDIVDRQLRCIGAEVYDHFGDFEKARALIEHTGARSKQRLSKALKQPSLPATTADERRARKVNVIEALQYGCLFYRTPQPDYRRCLDVWQDCEKYLRRFVITPEYPCHGTLSRILYACGLVHRQRSDYVKARRCFSDAVDESWRDIAEAPAELRPLSEYKIAKCLALGLAWIAYTEGALHVAGALLSAARCLLVNKRETVAKAYVDVIYSCVQMAAHGSEEKQLRDAVATLEKSYAIFEEKHRTYAIRAAHELALAYLRLGILSKGASGNWFAQAEQKAKIVAGSEAVRWQANGRIALSRVKRAEGNYREARGWADEALTLARDDAFIEIDALIASGEASLALSVKGAPAGHDAALADAIEHFERALSRGNTNPKIAAVCHLHLSNCFAERKSPVEAFRHFHHWQALEPRVEHAFPRQLAKDVNEKLIGIRADLVLRLDDASITAESADRAYSRFLYMFVLQHMKPDETVKDGAKRLLNISLRTWENYARKGGVPAQQIKADKSTRKHRAALQMGAAQGRL